MRGLIILYITSCLGISIPFLSRFSHRQHEIGFEFGARYLTMADFNGI